MKSIAAFFNKLLGDTIVSLPLTVPYWGVVYAFGHWATAFVFIMMSIHSLHNRTDKAELFKDVVYFGVVAVVTVVAGMFVGAHAGLLAAALAVLHNSLKWSVE